MERYVDVAPLDRIGPGTAIVVSLASETAALFNVAGHLYAIDDACVRCGASLAAGTLEGASVRCRCGWQYDLATGALNGVPALHVDTFDVKVEGSHVLVSSTAAWVGRER
jgi:nitrite reductase/ring-hydroxylating ferredoxin subunit